MVHLQNRTRFWKHARFWQNMPGFEQKHAWFWQGPKPMCFWQAPKPDIPKPAWFSQNQTGFQAKPDMKPDMKVDPGYPKRLLEQMPYAPKRFASCCRDARSTPCHPGRHGRPNRGGATLECLTRSSIAIVAGIWPGSGSRRCEGATVLGA